MPPPGGSELDRLLGTDTIRAFLDAFRPGAAPGRLTVEPAPPPRVSPHSDGTAERSITVDGRTLGTLVPHGAVPGVLLDAAAAGLEMAASEALARRALGREALQAYRELALHDRLADALAASVDPAEIGLAVLREARVAAEADAAALVPESSSNGAPARVPAASLGDMGDVTALLRDGRGSVARALATGTTSLTDARSGAGRASWTVLAAPVTAGGRVLAAVVVGRRGRAFTEPQVRLVATVASQAAVAWERAALHRLDADRQRRDHELGIGRAIQLSLLPQALPRAEGWEIGAAYEPAREVGGDFYDVFPVRGRPGSIALVIADVTGKGIPAALMMAFARPLLRAAADHSTGTAETLERANRVLVEERRSSLFITALHMRLQLRTGALSWAGAGHEPPLLVPADGRRIRRLPAGGTVLGLMPNAASLEHRLRLAPGDLIVAYTDGATDAQRADGTRFGEERLTRAARATIGLTASDAARSIQDAVHRFTSGAPAADDLALLTLRRVPRRAGRRWPRAR